MRLSMLTEQISCVEQNKEVIEQKIITMYSSNNPPVRGHHTRRDACFRLVLFWHGAQESL